jgi:outer membrane protein
MFRSVLFAGAMVLAAAPAHAQEIKIGFIDAPRVERDSVQGQRASEILKQEFGPREQEILDLQREIAEARARFESERNSLSERELVEKWKPIGAMMKQSDRMAYAMQENLRLRKSQIMVDFLRERAAAIETVGKAENFDLVVQEAIFSSNRIDITDQVLAEMAKRAGAAGQ